MNLVNAAPEALFILKAVYAALSTWRPFYPVSCLILYIVQWNKRSELLFFPQYFFVTVILSNFK